MAVHTKLTEARKQVMEMIPKTLEGFEVKVKVFTVEEDIETNDVEILVYRNGEYRDAVVTDCFESDELAAGKRAKVVLNSVKKWFDCSLVKVDNEVEHYHP
jgi:hypothetical protein